MFGLILSLFEPRKILLGLKALAKHCDALLDFSYIGNKTGLAMHINYDCSALPPACSFSKPCPRTAKPIGTPW